MATIQIPYKYLNALGPDKDQQLFELAVFARTVGATGATVGDTTSFVVQNDLLPMSICQLVVSQGGDILEYPVRIAIDDVKGDSPFTAINEEGNEVKQSREERSKHEIIEGTDGKFYVSGSDGKIERPLSTLAPVLGKLVSVEGYKTILPVENDIV